MGSPAGRPWAEVVVRGAAELVVAPPDRGPRRRGAADIGALPGGALAVAGGRVIWVGPESELEHAVQLDEATQVVHAEGLTVTPGLVDPHTHLIHGGERAGEFQLRCQGASYQQIAAAGGGIVSTMQATRAAREAELVGGGLRRVRRLLAQGVTCCEVKSGYGLSLADELKLLRAVRTLGRLQPVALLPTLLGAHAVPPEYRQRREDYLRLVIDEMIPAVVEQGLAVACDVFCEQGAFTVDESRRVLEAARAAGLGLHVHAEQFSASGGARLAAELGALSADHLEAVTDEDAGRLAAAGVVAVGLPGCNVFLDQAARLPARRLIEAGVRVALATDYNPGTSPTLAPLLMLTLGCARYHLDAAEALAAVTCEAARALGQLGERGTLIPGARADIAAFPVPSHVHLPYAFGALEATWVMIGGEIVWRGECV